MGANMERDVLQVLGKDHAVIAWLADRLVASPPGRARSLVFNEFSRTLGAHLAVIDRTVLPALRTCGWRGLTSDVLSGHMALKRRLAEVLTLAPDDEEFDAARSQLVTEVAKQRCREQDALLPVLNECLDDAQRSMLALDAELHLTSLLGQTNEMMFENVGMTRAADELLEEAYLVLGSFPAAGAPLAGNH